MLQKLDFGFERHCFVGRELLVIVAEGMCPTLLEALRVLQDWSWVLLTGTQIEMGSTGLQLKHRVPAMWQLAQAVVALVPILCASTPDRPVAWHLPYHLSMSNLSKSPARPASVITMTIYNVSISPASSQPSIALLIL